MAKTQITALTPTNTLTSSDEIMVRQGITDKRIKLQLSENLAWAKRNGYNYVGEYSASPVLTSSDDFVLYNGLFYFGDTGLSYPYVIDYTTYPLPDDDINLLRVIDSNNKNLNIDPADIGDYGVPTLNSSFKIKSSDLPPIAITSVTVVASEAEMLALTAEEGDVAVINTGDLSTQKTYMKNSGTSGTISDWTQVLTDAGFLTDVVYDTTPQLGGNLDLNGNIISDTNHGADCSTAIALLDAIGHAGIVGKSVYVDGANSVSPAYNYGYHWNVLGKRYDIGSDTCGYGGLAISAGDGNVAVGYNSLEGLPYWNYLYGTNNNNIGTGSTNYAAGDHTHSQYMENLSDDTTPSLSGNLNLAGTNYIYNSAGSVVINDDLVISSGYDIDLQGSSGIKDSVNGTVYVEGTLNVEEGISTGLGHISNLWGGISVGAGGIKYNYAGFTSGISYTLTSSNFGASQMFTSSSQTTVTLDEGLFISDIEGMEAELIFVQHSSPVFVANSTQPFTHIKNGVATQIAASGSTIGTAFNVLKCWSDSITSYNVLISY